ncbi:MAG: hypothetical protein C0518_00560 [Opitutus sp.]|nr:hypothetical protein [Opitutus sp.]
MALFLAHLATLACASWAAARHSVRHPIDRILAAATLAWTNIVLTSLALASFEQLGNTVWFFRTSLLLALVTWLALRWLKPEPAPLQREEIPATRLLLACGLTLAPLLYVAIRVAATYEPNNYDTLTYHLPRAMYYIGQGDLAHFETGNPRQIYFPFNYNLLQLVVLLHNVPVQAINFINLFAWLTGGLALYRLCRLAALSANASLIATWLALTSTQVLAQGTATTNDLPTGVALLCALVFALRWRETSGQRFALLAGVAAGLTAGSKLTVVFFGPTGALILVVLAVQHWRDRRFAAFMRGVAAWIPAGVVALALASPFAAINLAEKGEWINKTYDFTLNRPFSVWSVLQTGSAYLIQLFLEPLHRFVFDLKITAELNAWGARTFFPNWNEAYAFSPLYLFPPDLNEDHVFFGLTGPVVFLAGVYCLVRWRRFTTPVVWLAALGLGWFATYFVLNKWSLYNQRYFVPAILVLTPCLGACIDAGGAKFRPRVRSGLGFLAFCSLWLAAIYLFNNTSRPFAPLWAGQPPPPAWPTLPATMIERIAAEPRVNIHSTDGNERIFLLMAAGKRQRFTSFDAIDPAAYQVFSEWGFVRKVAYSNIEQLSSYTLAPFPTKRTAGVEFLGTIGQGQPALDYYGLAAHPNEKPSAEANRNVLVEFYYAPREPNRYIHTRIKVAGLNPADAARVIVGVDYADNSSEELAEFDHTGEAKVSITRPFRRFTVRIRDRADQRLLGSSDVPYLFRDQPAEAETPHDPMSLFAEELVAFPLKTSITTEGLAAPEGPYPQWDLPLIRWAKAPVVRLEIPGSNQLGTLNLSFELALHAREGAWIDVVHNGETVKAYRWEGPKRWLIQSLQLPAKPGKNIIEFRNVAVTDVPDWMDYLARYPDVKDYLVSQNIPLEKGAQEHWEAFGQRERRSLFTHRQTERIAGPDQLYYIFRRLRVDGFRQP